MPIKYPLQVEIEEDLQDSMDCVVKANIYKDSDPMTICRKIAEKYHNAIKRINEICKNRNRF